MILDVSDCRQWKHNTEYAEAAPVSIELTASWGSMNLLMNILSYCVSKLTSYPPWIWKGLIIMCFRRNILLGPQTINLFKFLLFLSTYFSTRVRFQVLQWKHSQRRSKVFFCFCTQARWHSLVAQMIKNLPAMQETCVRSLGWKDPLEEGMATHSSYSHLENSMNGETWLATVHGVTKSRTQLSD